MGRRIAEPSILAMTDLLEQLDLRTAEIAATAGDRARNGQNLRSSVPWITAAWCSIKWPESVHVRETAKMIDEEVAQLITEAKHRAMLNVKENRSFLDKLAEALLKKGRNSGRIWGWRDS